MTDARPTARSHITLALCMVLHAFTHAYGTMLVPLYLLMKADLKLGGVYQAALLVAVYGLVYSALAYPAGILADRFDRKLLLGIGLLANAAAIAGMGLTHSYPTLVILSLIAGLAGDMFHPAANALVPAHYPNNPGLAIGLLGMGSGLGFFFGPQYAGWRAEHAHWQLWNISQWQKPCIELGVMGLTVGIIFLLVARETRQKQASVGIHLPFPRDLFRRIIGLALILGFRDFAGMATISLSSIYLQKAHGLSVEKTGLIVGGMMLLSVVVNPLSVYVSPGKRRLPALRAVLCLAGITIAAVPYVPLRWTFVTLLLFQTFQMGSYAISDSAMLERVPPDLRGRVVGLFLTFAGTLAGTSPWIMGLWTDLLGQRALTPAGYAIPYGTLGVMMWLAMFSPAVIEKLGPVLHASPVNPLSEIMPSSVEPVGA